MCAVIEFILIWTCLYTPSIIILIGYRFTPFTLFQHIMVYLLYFNSSQLCSSPYNSYSLNIGRPVLPLNQPKDIVKLSFIHNIKCYFISPPPI